MSLNRYAKKRDANERPIAAFLRANGVCLDGRSPVDFVAGFLNGRGVPENWLLEIKGPDGELTDGQKVFLARWRGPWVVLKTLEDAQRWLRMVRGFEPYTYQTPEMVGALLDEQGRPYTPKKRKKKRVERHIK